MREAIEGVIKWMEEDSEKQYQRERTSSSTEMAYYRQGIQMGYEMAIQRLQEVLSNEKSVRTGE